MSTENYPSVDYVRQCVREESGRLFWLTRPREHFKSNRGWKVWNAQHSGTEAGTLTGNPRSPDKPRCCVSIRKRKFLRYAIVWALHKGEWRLGLDHEDRDQLNDRIENLRPANQSQNTANATISKNNTSGRKGVSWFKRYNKWSVRIKVNYKNIHLGYFDDLSEAGDAYLEAAKKYFGEFACSG